MLSIKTIKKQRYADAKGDKYTAKSFLMILFQ
jgi:hypothetical protein